MANEKFTPAPWKVKIKNEGIADICGEKIRSQQHGDREIANLFRADDRHDAIEEWMANIRLIAAAPEMYEILDEILMSDGMMPDTLGKINELLNKINDGK